MEVHRVHTDKAIYERKEVTWLSAMCVSRDMELIPGDK